MGISEEVKGVIVGAIALVIITFVIAACNVNETRERTKVLAACFEQVENPVECAWFDRSNSTGKR